MSADRKPGEAADQGPTPRRRSVLVALIGVAIVAGSCGVLFKLPAVWFHFQLLRVAPGDFQLSPRGDTVTSRGAANLLIRDRRSLPFLIPLALDEAKRDQGLTWRGLAVATAYRAWRPARVKNVVTPLTSTEYRFAVDPALLEVVDSGLQSRQPGLAGQARFLIRRSPDVSLLDSLLAHLKQLRSASPRDSAALADARRTLDRWIQYNGRWARRPSGSGPVFDPDVQDWMSANTPQSPPLPDEAMESLRRWRAKLDERGLPKQTRWRLGG